MLVRVHHYVEDNLLGAETVGGRHVLLSYEFGGIDTQSISESADGLRVSAAFAIFELGDSVSMHTTLVGEVTNQPEPTTTKLLELLSVYFH